MLNANFTDVFFGNTIIKCTIWQLNSREAAFKQLSPLTGLADEYEVKKVHIHQVCIKHAVFITFAFRSSKKWEMNYETKSLD